MREIVLDTETTGFDPDQGDRIVEIGAVELSGHMPTDRTYHQYVNPERPMSRGAFEVHGLGDDFLRDKPVFADVGRAFLEFVGDARLVIHNAAFDMRFLNFELKRAGLATIAEERAVDTLAIAKQRFPGASNSLDALCRRFRVDNSGRVKHGALLDSEILAEVYLELMGGRQPDLVLGPSRSARRGGGADAQGRWRPEPRPTPPRVRLTPAESQAHAAFVGGLAGGGLWGEPEAGPGRL